MSDYRNYDPNDPLRGDPQLDPNARPPSSAWGWIAAAIFLVVVIAVAFGYGHRPGQLGTNTASNDVSAPAATHMTAPATVPPPSTAPAPGTPTTPPSASPNASAPANPAPQPAAH